MRKLIGVALAGLLGLAGVAPALAQQPAAAPEAVLGEQAYQDLPVQTRIDLVSALVARGQLDRAMGQVPTQEGEAVLGEQATAGSVSAATTQEMLQQLKARANLD